MHGTEMYGIVGQQRPGHSDEQARRDTCVRDALLDFAAGNHDRLWKAVTTEPPHTASATHRTTPLGEDGIVLERFERTKRRR